MVTPLSLVINAAFPEIPEPLAVKFKVCAVAAPKVGLEIRKLVPLTETT